MRAWRANGAPAEVSLDDVKANARILHDDDDLLLQGLIDAAHERAEQETGRVFGEGGWIIEADATPIVSPIWPIISAPTGWTVDTLGRATVLHGALPTDKRIEVRAGEAMPATVRQAVILMACHWFENRSGVSADQVREVPYAATALLALNRRVFV